MSEDLQAPAASRNRIGLAGFVLNIAAVVLFFVMASTAPTAADSTSVEDAAGDVFATGMNLLASAALSTVVMAIGTLCCLIGLIWRPRLWSVLGLGVGVGASLLFVLAMKPEAGGEGAYSPAGVDDSQVVAAAEFAVEEQSRNSGATVELVEIRKAATQPVGLTNYRLDLAVTENTAPREALAVVWKTIERDPSGNPIMKLSAWDWR